MIYDLIGIGLGPANLALAIALEEHLGPDRLKATVKFVERRSAAAWHPGMLLQDSRLQVTFLKDLVTMRNPMSPYSFLNYLRVRGRLHEFINLRNLFPSRVEFSDYLEWVASHYSEISEMGTEVLSVEPLAEPNGTITSVLVKGRNGWVRQTRNLVIAVGAVKKLPVALAKARHVRNLIHSIDYLTATGNCDMSGKTIAVIGSGQSAAEVTYDLIANRRAKKVVAIFRDLAYRPPDESEFTGETYFPDYIDKFYAFSLENRERTLQSLRGTNYSVVDPDLTHKMYSFIYQKKVSNEPSPIDFFSQSSVERVDEDSTGKITLTCLSGMTGEHSLIKADMVVAATGFESSPNLKLMDPILKYLEVDHSGAIRIQRDYSIAAKPGFQPLIYLQGGAERTHGPSDTLLSLSSVRAGDVADSLLRRLDAAASGKTAAAVESHLS